MALVAQTHWQSFEKVVNRLTAVLAVGVLALLVGCNQEKPAGTSGTAGTSGGSSGSSAQVNTELAGNVTIDGSSTVYPISEAVAAGFKKVYPKVNVTVGKSGTGGGFKRFTVGETDVSDASRPITKSEFDACKQNNVKFIELPIAYDGLTVCVHPSNTFIDVLTVDQLKKIFLDGSPPPTKWNEIDPSWPDTAIKLYAPGTDSGTFDYFKEVIAGKTGSIRGDMATSEDDSVLVNGVVGDQGAMGFFGVAYYMQNKDKLKVIKIINPETGSAVEPTPASIEDGSYSPFSRPLFIYVNAEAIHSAQLEEFVEYYLKNAAAVATQVGYVPLPASVYEQANQNFRDEHTGTHYQTADGESRHGKVVDVYRPENRLD